LAKQRGTGEKEGPQDTEGRPWLKSTALKFECFQLLVNSVIRIKKQNGLCTLLQLTFK